MKKSFIILGLLVSATSAMAYADCYSLCMKAGNGICEGGYAACAQSAQGNPSLMQACMASAMKCLDAMPGACANKCSDDSQNNQEDNQNN